jgi:hypothetical protein
MPVYAESPLITSADLADRLLSAAPVEDSAMTLSEEVKSKGVYYGVCVGVILIALLYLIFWPDHWWPYRDHAIDVAVTLFLAATMAVGVDQFVKRHFIHDVSQNVFHAILGYDLPDQVKDRIRELLKTAIVRRKYEAVFRLNLADNDLMRVNVDLAYELENWSFVNKPYTPPLCVEKHDQPRLLKLSFTVPNGQSYSWDESELARPERRADSDSHVLCINAEARDIAPRSEGRTHKVRLSYELLVPRDHSEVLAFTDFTLGAEIRCSERPEGYDFTASTGDQNGPEWTIARLLSPDEHIRIRWFAVQTSPGKVGNG